MVMDKYYHQVDPRQELWEKINKLHLSYLEMEESPQKLEHRNKLEDCINEYLCLVPHNQKFELPCTAEVLYRSASSNKDFSGYRAALGFDAVGRYAANLITKPWRREYRQIKMYSGFYKHEIESNLVGAEMMFEAMGYRQVGREILVLEGPICPDQATSVSLDSLMAYVECQILKTVWEEVSSVFKVSWLDVLKFREAHLCSPKQLVSSLIYMSHQRQYQEKAPNYQPDLMCNPKMNMHHISHHHQLQPSPYPILPPTHMPAPCMYQMNGCCGGGAYMPCHPPQYPPPPYVPFNCIPVKPQFVTPHYKYNTTVPTAQLIELDHTYDTPDAPQQRRYDNVAEIDKKMRQLYVSDRKTPSEPKVSDRDDGSGTFESWDYVYRNLESQGYSKDLGERGDILSLDLEDRRNNTIKTAKKVDTRERKKSDHNVYDNLQPSIKTMPKPEKKIQPTVTPTPGPSNSISIKQPEVKKKSEINKTGMNPSGDWHCSACTYLNTSSKDICEICSKSRNGKVEELQAGGTECNKCTYVNNKEEKVCVVCGASLDKNPTYI